MGYPFAENSAKIINLIFEPFPNLEKVNKDEIIYELPLTQDSRYITILNAEMFHSQKLLAFIVLKFSLFN